MSTAWDIRGDRGLLSAEQATALVASMGRDPAAVTTIVFGTRSITNPAAEVLARVLEKMTALVTADLADIISGIHEDEALRSLTILCDALARGSGAQGSGTLRHVDLSDNALGTKGLRASKSALTGELHSLRLCNDGLSGDACNEVWKLVTDSGARNCELRKVAAASTPAPAPLTPTLLTHCPRAHVRAKRLPAERSPACPSTPPTTTRPPAAQLHFWNNMSGDEGGIHVGKLISKHCPHLQDFRLSSTRCGAEGGVALGNGLARATGRAVLCLAPSPRQRAFPPPGWLHAHAHADSVAPRARNPPLPRRLAGQLPEPHRA